MCRALRFATRANKTQAWLRSRAMRRFPRTTALNLAIRRDDWLAATRMGRLICNASEGWRPRPELNRGKRFCRPLRNHSATWPSGAMGSGSRRIRQCPTHPRHQRPGARLRRAFAQTRGTRQARTAVFFPPTSCGAAGQRGQNVRGRNEPGLFMLSMPDRLCYMRSDASRLFPGSSAVEQPAVNRLVAGSNPARGATLY